MQAPDVVTEVRDRANNMLYRFLAYRKLSQYEIQFHLGRYLSQPKLRRRKRPERNKVVIIQTIHGVSPGL